MTFYNKRGVGERKFVIDNKGKRHERQLWFVFLLNEQIQLVEAIDDPDHMYIQNQLPITKEEFEKYKLSGNGIPKERLGPLVVCDCGSETVLVLDPKAPPAWQNKLVCRSLAQFGYHQTSLNIKDGKIELTKKQKDNLYMLDSDMTKILKPGDDK